MREERPLVVYTFLAQLAVGGFWFLAALAVWTAGRFGTADAAALTRPAWPAVPALMAAAMAASFFHLGSPLRAWRAVGNLPSSWLSREILFTLLFSAAGVLAAVVQWIVGSSILSPYMLAATALLGLCLVVSMANAYRLRTVPAWRTRITVALFLLTALLLGAIGVGSILLLRRDLPSDLVRPAWRAIGWGIVLLVAAVLWLSRWWWSRLAAGSESARGALARLGERRSLLLARLILAIVGWCGLLAVLIAGQSGPAAVVPLLLILAGEVCARALFYHARLREGV